jgi:voltage-gated potassium channel
LNRLIQKRHLTSIVVGASLMALIMLVGTVGYHTIGSPNATWVNSFYMTFITIATIGYGEVIDLSQSPMGRLFTVLISVLGIGTMSYLFSTVVAVLIDTDLNAAMRRKRMDKDMAKMNGHYIVCGIGRVGSNVARELMRTKRSFVVIENDRSALDNWLEHHPETQYLHEDAADDAALQRAGLANAAGVFAVTGDDSHNLMVAMSVKLLHAKVRVVVRLHDVRNTKKAKRAGADEIVSTDFTGGMRITSAMVRPHVVNFMDKMLHSDEGLRVEEVVVPLGFASKPLSALIPKSKDYLLMAIHENGKWLFNPSDDHLVQAGATLVVMANPDGRAHVETLVKV